MKRSNRNNVRRRISTLNQAMAKQTAQRCFKVRVPGDPPSVMNSGDVWHPRKIQTTSVAASNGEATLTAGAVLASLSGNAGNLPVRIMKICAWAIAGTAGTYPPTFLQVNFQNEEFCQNLPANAAARDSITDGSGPGHIAAVGLSIPSSLQLTRDDWGTASTTVLATAVALPSGARVLWQVSLAFKF